MDFREETPEAKRERLRQEELKGNPMGTFGDGINQSCSIWKLIRFSWWFGMERHRNPHYIIGSRLCNL